MCATPPYTILQDDDALDLLLTGGLDWSNCAVWTLSPDQGHSRQPTPPYTVGSTALAAAAKLEAVVLTNDYATRSVDIARSGVFVYLFLGGRGVSLGALAMERGRHSTHAILLRGMVLGASTPLRWRPEIKPSASHPGSGPRYADWDALHCGLGAASMAAAPLHAEFAEHPEHAAPCLGVLGLASCDRHAFADRGLLAALSSLLLPLIARLAALSRGRDVETFLEVIWGVSVLGPGSNGTCRGMCRNAPAAGAQCRAGGLCGGAV